MIDIEQPPVIEKAVLLRLILPDDSDREVEESLDEMRSLAWTAGADICCTVVQRRDKPCPATLVGAGKVEQLLAVCEEHEAGLVIVDSNLTPAQGSTLGKKLDRKVIDRTQLILDIFAQRARTREGRHQVELAQLEYLLPRLAGRGTVMRQQGGIGIRGPGEQKLEVDRRVIRNRIARLKHELEEVRRQRQTQRKRRLGSTIPTVALVGYTNAGKSSLLNALTGAGALVEDKLFATLDPTSRRCVLPGGREVVLSDTVGFVRSLPHGLVAAFRATLEEVNDADLLLLVVDAAHPNAEDHIQAVFAVLDEIKAGPKPMIRVLNKADIADAADLRLLTRDDLPCVSVSARTGVGLDQLLDLINAHFSRHEKRMSFRIPQSEAGLVTRLHGAGKVLSETYEDNDILIEAALDPSQITPFLPYRT